MIPKDKLDLLALSNRVYDAWLSDSHVDKWESMGPIKFKNNDDFCITEYFCRDIFSVWDKIVRSGWAIRVTDARGEGGAVSVYFSKFPKNKPNVTFYTNKSDLMTAFGELALKAAEWEKEHGKV
jgi:hypothetical protein